MKSQKGVHDRTWKMTIQSTSRVTFVYGALELVRRILLLPKISEIKMLKYQLVTFESIAQLVQNVVVKIYDKRERQGKNQNTRDGDVPASCLRTWPFHKTELLGTKANNGIY